MNNALKTEEVTEKSSEIVQIPIESILPNRSQPRTTFENDSLIRLAESIRQYGILQPLTVRKIPENSKFSIFQYELIAGERRLRAARYIGVRTVPCIILEADTQTSAALAIIENLHRDNLNIFEEASAIASLIELHKLTQEQIAKQLSLTQAAIANKLRLLKLTEAEKSVILSNNLTERHARALLKIKNSAERIEALAHITKNSYNVKQTEEYIEKLLNPKDSPSTQIISSYQNLVSSITRAIEHTRNGGIAVKTSQTETDTDIVYTISISKTAK